MECITFFGLFLTQSALRIRNARNEGMVLLGAFARPSRNLAFLAVENELQSIR